MNKMHVGICRITLHLPASRSLKDKRQVIRSLSDRLRNRLGVSVAEIGGHDRWQISVLGIATVSGAQSVAQTALDRVEEFVETFAPDVLLTDFESDVLDLT